MFFWYKHASKPSTLWVLVSLFFAACVPFEAESTGESGSAQSNASTMMGQHAECGGPTSGMFFDSASRSCVSEGEGVETTLRQAQPGMPMGGLHPIAHEQHLATGQDRDTPTAELAAKYDYFRQLEAPNALKADGDIDGWKLGASFAYKRLLAEQFALPLLAQESASLNQTEAMIGYGLYQLSEGKIDPTLYGAAQRMADQYERLLWQDERLAPMSRALGSEDISAKKFQDCVNVLGRESDYILLDTATAGCASIFLAVVPEIQALNAQRQVYDNVLLERYIESAELLQQRTMALGGSAIVHVSEEPALFLHFRELGINVLTAFHAVVDPELQAQAMYGHLRMTLEVEVKGVDGQPAVSTQTLGQWAHQLVHKTSSNASSQAERLSYFADAFLQVIGQLRSNNTAVTEELSSNAIDPEKAWHYGLLMQHSGLMSLYGGYDGLGQPMGFQRIHDVLLGEAEAHEIPRPMLALGALATCATTMWVLGPASPGAAVVCALGAWVSVTEYQRFAQLVSVANTAAFVGLEYSLVPAPLSLNLQRRLRVAGFWAAADIVLSVADVALSLTDAFALAKSRQWFAADEQLNARIDEIIDNHATLRKLFPIEDAYAAGPKEIMKMTVNAHPGTTHIPGNVHVRGQYWDILRQYAREYTFVLGEDDLDKLRGTGKWLINWTYSETKQSYEVRMLQMVDARTLLPNDLLQRVELNNHLADAISDFNKQRGVSHDWMHDSVFTHYINRATIEFTPDSRLIIEGDFKPITGEDFPTFLELFRALSPAGYRVEFTP
ncbi:MAG: hypothetical protein IPJ88_09360 [Myxococcales bacterium]|nr:MAG: hypothetical protein IPJ88_09360 [Myxococcales bacterium]